MLNILTKIILCSTSLLLMATTNSNAAMQQPQDTLKACPDSVTAIGTEQPCQKARTQVERCKAMPKSHAMAAGMADSMMLNHPLAHDLVWHNSISGSRVHLQRLAPYDSLVKRRPQPWKALAVDLSINASILAFDYFVQNRDYARISKHVLRRNFRNGFVFDNDSFSGNQVLTPLSRFDVLQRRPRARHWLWPVAGLSTHWQRHMGADVRNQSTCPQRPALYRHRRRGHRRGGSPRLRLIL